MVLRVTTAGQGDPRGGGAVQMNTPQGNNQQLQELQAEINKLKKRRNKPGRIGFTDDIEDAWVPGAQEAANIYNQGLGELDPNDYLGQTMANLQALQDPTQNPYLLDMLQTGQQSIADQTLSSLGLSGRAPGTIDPITGMASDSALNLINNLGDFTSGFLGNQYQADMNRALSAVNTGMAMTPDVLGTIQQQPWQNLQNYSGIVSQLTGSSPQQPERQRTSGWDKLVGLGTVAGSLLGSGGISGIL